MKKFLSLLLAVMMLLACIPAMAEDDPEWKINEFTGLVSRKSAAEKSESIIVPAEVDGMAVRGIEYMAFNMHKNFKQLTIADSAVMLDRRVLRDLLKLEGVDLPENLLVIREGNFTNLPKLTSVVVPANVALVHSSFNKCASLTSITFEGMCPIFVTEGTFGMFTDLPADCVIYVPDNQVSAYKAALADREDVVARIQPSGKNAERIDRTAPESDFTFDASTGTITGYTGTANYLKIPSSIGGVQVKHIADDALLKKHSLCCIVVPEGVESLGASSLAGVENLSYVSLPSSLTSVGASAFSVSRVSVISYNTAAVPAYEAAAFDYIKSDAWQLILPYGTSQEQVDAFAAYLAANAPKAVVKASIIEPYSFPKLDAEAGAAYIGNWTGVAVTDGTDFYGMDLLGISLTAALQDDGTGIVDIDGDAAPGGWYVENGEAIFAPILEEGGQPAPEEAMPFTLDENGRMCLDLGGLIVLMEKEGETYAVPAIPEKPWPELDAEKAAAYIGTWDAVSYVVDGETVSAELVGPMTLILNADGTAQMIEGEEEAYELRWYAESYSAYVGPAMSALAEIYFDMNGDLQMKQDGSKIIMKPHVDVKVIEGADELLGEWLDDIGNKLVLTNDGVMTYTYASDGWVNEYKWDMVDGAAVVTEGNWVGCPITLENGILIISGDNAFQLFSVDGDLSAYYGDDDELPEAQPIGPEGEPYFGVWKLESMMGMNAADMGMTMDLYLNEDGTCSIFDGYEHDYNVWAVENGAAMVDGSPLTINAEGKLVMSQEGMDMIFVKGEGAAIAVIEPADEPEEEPEEEDDEELPEAQPIGPEGEPYFGTWTMDLGGMAMNLTLNQDGTCAMEMMGEAEPGVWFVADGKANVMGDELIIDGDGNLVAESLGMVFAKVEGEVSSEEMTEEEQMLAFLALMAQMEEAENGGEDAAENADPYIGRKFLMTGTMINGIQLTAAQLGAEGDYIIFNADGSAELFMGGRMIDNRGWKRGTVTVVGAEYEGFCVDYYGTMYNFGIVEDGLLLDYFGTPRLYEAESAPAPAAPAAPTEPEAPVSLHLDRTFKLTTASTVYAGQLFPVDVAAYGEYNVRLGSDGSVKFVQSGLELPADCLSWTTNADGAYVVSYGVGGVVMMEYTFKPVGNALEMDYYGVTMTFTPAE